MAMRRSSCSADSLGATFAFGYLSYSRNEFTLEGFGKNRYGYSLVRFACRAKDHHTICALVRYLISRVEVLSDWRMSTESTLSCALSRHSSMASRIRWICFLTAVREVLAPISTSATSF